MTIIIKSTWYKALGLGTLPADDTLFDTVNIKIKTKISKFIGSRCNNDLIET